MGPLSAHGPLMGRASTGQRLAHQRLTSQLPVSQLFSRLEREHLKESRARGSAKANGFPHGEQHVATRRMLAWCRALHVL